MRELLDKHQVPFLSSEGGADAGLAKYQKKSLHETTNSLLGGVEEGCELELLWE